MKSENTNIALLFGLFPNENYAEIIDKSKGVIQYAADTLQKSFVEGIGSICHTVEIINLPYIGSYPQRYKSLFSANNPFEITTSNGNTIKGYNYRFCNLMGYKMLDRFSVAKHSLLQWCIANQTDDKVIIVYAMHSPFLKAAIEAKMQFKDSTKVILVVPDLPQYMGGPTSFPYSLFNKVNQKSLWKSAKEVDGFILLSKYMVDALPIGDKPWAVVEGIYNQADDFEVATCQTKRQIFYSGTLARRYGIINLVEAFHKLKEEPDIELIICGAGDAEQSIKELASVDNRIKFKGQLPRAKVLELQRQATLLVNPRTPEGEFTKYSFPSKTMEYMASGRPCLLYKLPGIPEEYYKYCYTIDAMGTDYLQNKLKEILHKSDDELNVLGNSAREFILREKNPISQCSKIAELIGRITRN